MHKMLPLLQIDELSSHLESQLSTHEQRLAELSKQIASLEAENVGDKDWTMIGEANARSRPQNSLLEEDLEFEHAAKQVPIITEEVTKSLEDRIKARILEVSLCLFHHQS